MTSKNSTRDHGGYDRGRIWILDAARGGAVAAMVVFHALFDIKFFLGYNFFADYPNIWKFGAWIITATFMLCVGASMEVSGGGKRGFLRRQMRIGLGAVAVSLGTYLVLPDWWVRFGVLHCIFFGSFVCWLLVGRSGVAVVLGALVLIGGYFFPGGALPPRPSGPSLDYVPLIPWLGVALVGMGAGNFLRKMAGVDGRSRRGGWGGGFLWLGRHSLAIYLLHQPIIVGILFLAARWL